MLIKHYKDLEIYKIAIQLDKEVEKLIKNIPHYWSIKESDQIMRSSQSVPSNIVEGFSNRFYPKKFHYYLNISLGSSDETQKHLIALKNKKHIGNDFNYFFKEYKDLSIKILNFINYLRKKHKI